MSNRKGDRHERNFVNALSAVDGSDRKHVERYGLNLDDVVGWFAVRLPASGGGRVADLPDVHVWVRRNDTIRQFAVEVKAASERVRLSNGEVAALRSYGEQTLSVPRVFAHIDSTSRTDSGGGDYVVSPDTLHSTDKGYTFTKNRDGGKPDECTGEPLADWVRSV
jgi:Holliday junction resolvase